MHWKSGFICVLAFGLMLFVSCETNPTRTRSRTLPQIPPPSVIYTVESILGLESTFTPAKGVYVTRSPELVDGSDSRRDLHDSPIQTSNMVQLAQSIYSEQGHPIRDSMADLRAGDFILEISVRVGSIRDLRLGGVEDRRYFIFIILLELTPEAIAEEDFSRSNLVRSVVGVTAEGELVERDIETVTNNSLDLIGDNAYDEYANW